MRHLPYRFGKAFQSYRSPFWLGLQCAAGFRHVELATDQGTGLSFRCVALRGD